MPGYRLRYVEERKHQMYRRVCRTLPRPGVRSDTTVPGRHHDIFGIFVSGCLRLDKQASSLTLCKPCETQELIPPKATDLGHEGASTAWRSLEFARIWHYFQRDLQSGCKRRAVLWQSQTAPEGPCCRALSLQRTRCNPRSEVSSVWTARPWRGAVGRTKPGAGRRDLI